MAKGGQLLNLGEIALPPEGVHLRDATFHVVTHPELIPPAGPHSWEGAHALYTATGHPDPGGPDAFRLQRLVLSAAAREAAALGLGDLQPSGNQRIVSAYGFGQLAGYALGMHMRGQVAGTNGAEVRDPIWLREIAVAPDWQRRLFGSLLAYQAVDVSAFASEQPVIAIALAADEATHGFLTQAAGMTIRGESKVPATAPDEREAVALHFWAGSVRAVQHRLAQRLAEATPPLATLLSRATFH